MQTVLIIGLIIFIIWIFVKKTNIENEHKTQQISGELRVKYPNFVKAIRKIALTDYSLFADNNKALTYKIPVLTYKRPMGDLYYCLIDTTNVGNKPYLLIEYRGLDGVIITTEKNYLESDDDLSLIEYSKIFDELAKDLMSDERYLKSVTKGFM